MNARKQQINPKDRVNKLLQQLGVASVLKQLDRKNQFIDELMEDMSQNQQRQVIELKKQLQEATFQNYMNDVQQKKNSTAIDNKKFVKKIQDQFIDDIKNINTLPLYDVNKLNLDAKNQDTSSKTHLGENIKLQAKQDQQGSGNGNNKILNNIQIDSQNNHKHIQYKIASQIKQKYSKMSYFDQFLDEHFELNIQRSIPTSLSQRNHHVVNQVNETIHSLIDQSRPLEKSMGDPNSKKFSRKRQPNSESSYSNRRDPTDGFSQREIADKIKHQFDLKDKRKNEKMNSVKLHLPHTHRVIPKKNFLKAMQADLAGEELTYHEYQQEQLRDEDKHSIYNLGLSVDMQILLEKNKFVKERSKSKIGVPAQVLQRNSVNIPVKERTLIPLQQGFYKLIAPSMRVSSRKENIIQSNFKKSSPEANSKRSSNYPQPLSGTLSRRDSLQFSIQRQKDTNPLDNRRMTRIDSKGSSSMLAGKSQEKQRFKSMKGFEREHDNQEEQKPLALQRRGTLVQRIDNIAGIKDKLGNRFKDIADILKQEDEEEESQTTEEVSESSFGQLSLIQEKVSESGIPKPDGRASLANNQALLNAQKRFQYKMLQVQQRIDTHKLITRKDAIEVFLERKQEILQKDHVYTKEKLSEIKVGEKEDEVQILNNQKKFVNFLIDTHYHQKNKAMRTEIDTRRLFLKNKYIGPKQLKAILKILSRNAKQQQNRIAHIDLSNNEIGDQGVMHLAKWIKAEQGHQKKDEVVISSSESSESDSKSQSSAEKTRELVDFQEVQKTNMISVGNNESPELESPSCCRSSEDKKEKITSENETFSDTVPTEDQKDQEPSSTCSKAADQLVSLKLSQVSASSKAFLFLLKVLRSNRTLIELDISNKDGFLRNSNMSMKCLKKGICPYLRQPYCVLSHLNIQGCNIGNEGFERLSEAAVQNQYLVILNVGSNGISGMQSANAIIRILSECFNILDLNISSNNMGNISMSRIFTHLYIQGASLRHLDISNCGITQVQCGTDIGRFKMGLPLQSLNFSGNILKQTLNTIMQDLQLSRAAGESTQQQSQKKQSQTTRGYQSPQKVPDPPRTNPRQRYLIDQSISRLQALVMERDYLQDLNLSKCLLGDSAFRAVMHGIHRVQNSERLTLNLSKNKLTNQSISYITEIFLNFKPELKPEDANSRSKDKNKFEVNDKVKLRLKGLNLSGNFLRSRSTINFDEIKKMTHDGFEKDCVHNEGPNVFQNHFNPKLMECELKRFFSLINYQIFIENIDLSYNKELGEDLAHFIYKYLSQYEVMKDPQFNFTKLKSQKSQSSSPGRSPASKARAGQTSPSKADGSENTSRKMKYQKNLLLLNLNLHKCCIGQHQVDLINNILDTNKKLRRYQLKRLQETEHFVLTNSNVLNQNLGLKQQSAKNNLIHVKSEHAQLQQYYKDKLVAQGSAQAKVKTERDGVLRQLNALDRDVLAERVREKKIAQAYEVEAQKLEVAESQDVRECQKLDAAIKQMEAEMGDIKNKQDAEKMEQEKLLIKAQGESVSGAMRIQSVERGIKAIVSPEANQRIQQKQKESKPNTKKRSTSRRMTHAGTTRQLGGRRSTSPSALASTKKSLGGSKSMNSSNLITQMNSKQHNSNERSRPAIVGIERKQGPPTASIFGQPDEKKRQRAKSAGIRGRSSNVGRISRPQSQRTHERRKSTARTKRPLIAQESTLSFLKEDHDTKQSQDQLPGILQSSSAYVRIPMKPGQKSRPKTSRGNFGILEKIQERKETALDGFGAASSGAWPEESI